MKELTKAEEILLLTIWKLKDNAYGVTIRDKVKDLTDRLYVYGTLYSTLDQMISKGLIAKRQGEPTNKRGGRSKAYYTLTKIGGAALKMSYSVQKNVWNGVSDSTFEEIS